MLVCSRESLRQAKLFGQLCQSFTALKDRVEIDVWLNRGDVPLLKATELPDHPPLEWGWDFDDFDQIFRALTALVEWLGRGENGLERKEIAIDVTGGPKPATMAAAAATMNSAVVNQHVCTNPRSRDADLWEYDVLEYDLLVQAAGSFKTS